MEYLVSLLVLVSLITSVAASTHNASYVLPADSSPLDCPAEPCFTLDQYIDQATSFTTGSTFVFLAGNHTLRTAVGLTNVSNITFIGEVSDADANIVCKNGITILCSNVTSLNIRNLVFNGISNSDRSIVLRAISSESILISHSEDQNTAIAISASNSTLIITSCLFDSYSVGAIYVSNKSNIVLTGTTFTKNTANYSGGAIFAHHSSVTLNGTLTNRFAHNSASLYGGAIYCHHCFINMTGHNIFENNSAKWGTIGIYKGEIIISGTARFSSNRATYGGGLYLFNSTATLGGQELTFDNNLASIGGALCSNRESYVTIRTAHLHWINNTANSSGGAIFANTGFVTLGNDLNHHHNFSHNSGGVGGAIACQICNIIIHGNNNFSNNHVLGSGGAVYINRGNVTLCGNAIFINNWAENQGGACYFVRSYARFSGKGIQFITNTAHDGGAICSDLSTLVVYVKQLNFVSNVAERYGGAVVILGGTDKETLLTGMYFGNKGKLGGAICINGNKNATIYNIVVKNNSENVLCIVESKVEFRGQVLIANNSGKQWGVVYSLNSFVSFTGNYTLIANNSGEQGGGVYSLNSFVSFYGVTEFLNNVATTGGAISSLYSRIVIQGPTEFAYNTAHSNGGAIYASGTNITIKGRVHFSFNSAQNGGAMFYETSAFLNLHASIYFSHNHASKYGGAIYNEDTANLLQCTYKSPQKSRKDNDVVDRLPYCFMQIEGIRLIFEKKIFISNISITSYNDSAEKGGDFLYGGLLDRCKMFLQLYYHGKIAFVPYILFMQDDWLRIRNMTTKEITSQPYQLCFCNSDDDCSQAFSLDVHRGQKFSVHLLATDQIKSLNSPLVTARTSPTARLKFNQSIQALHNHCTHLTYSIYSAKSHEELILYTEGPCRDSGLGRAVVNVTLLACPDGFTQREELCVCEERLQEYTTNCIIDEEITITRNAGSKFWMSALYKNKIYQGLILCKTCPVEYCTIETVNISLGDPDVQCDLNRSELLCGACATISGLRLSLMLGSAQCGECSNTYLALLLPFAVAGIALVVFLSILRLTVATGMINGVILYANIIQANRNLFFPTNTVTVLSVFIAWMNLDLGFKTCFYDGMTAYAQTWLQFVFPIYVWILISLIILISRYSITVSKLIGHNPIAVLATLLLMSYTKILKIVIDVYTFTKLDYPDNHTVPVWLKDANVPYLQSWHLLLTVVTSLVLVFIFLPYTILLLLGYKLYRFSGGPRSRWLNRLKPLLDSYYAPYKKHTRYWTGFLLLVRCALYVVFTFNSRRATSAALILALTAIVIKAWLFGRIYEKLCLDIIESSIYLNLTVLSTLTIAEICLMELTYSLIGIVFITTIGTIVFQFLLLYTGNFFLRLRTAFHNIVKFKTQTARVPPIASRSMSTASFIDLREALLLDT